MVITLFLITKVNHNIPEVKQIKVVIGLKYTNNNNQNKWLIYKNTYVLICCSSVYHCKIPDFDVQKNEGDQYFPKLSFLENCANEPCKWKVKTIKDK